MKNISLISATLFAVGFSALASAQVNLYNDLTATATNGYGSGDGGQNDFGGVGYGDQTGQVFTDTGASSISQVEAEYLGFDASSSATGLLIQVFNFSGGSVGTMVGQQTITNFSENDTAAGGNFSGYENFDITAATNISGIVSGNQYLLTMQVQGPNWAFLENDGSGTPGTYVRNYSSFGNSGGFGASWAELSTLGYTSGNSLMSITGAQAVPSPAGILALGLGIGALIIRKRR